MNNAIEHYSFYIAHYPLYLLQQRIEGNELVSEPMFDTFTQGIGILLLIKIVIFHRVKIELNGIGRAAIIEFG